MLTITKILQRDVRALETLAALPEHEAAGFLDAVAKTEPTIGRVKFVVQVTRALPAMQKAVADELMRAVLGMQAARIAWEATPEEFVKALAAAENVVESKALSSKAELWRKRLLALLSTESAFLTAKAAMILTAQEHPFESARIYTDIRPIFADQLAEAVKLEPSAAVLVHRLRLRLGGENQPRELDVALDNRDLDALARAVERAKQKAAMLTEIMERSNLRHLEPPQE